MIHYADPPILLRDVLDDVHAARVLLARAAPYSPLGGWYRPDADPDSATNPLWFQNDWVHADLRVPGSELFLHHPRVIQAARDFYRADVVLPHSVYVNVMVALDRAGPAHTDNPRFQGRERSNTPMWLLRTMLWSGLFDRFSIVQATSIWWMNDVMGGEFRYWPKGPAAPPERHIGDMANTALVGDNHGMFHQVGPVGPFGKGLQVSPRAELAPAEDGSGDWEVRDRGALRFRAPLGDYRVSVLWKADVYPNEDERPRTALERAVCDGAFAAALLGFAGANAAHSADVWIGTGGESFAAFRRVAQELGNVGGPRCTMLTFETELAVEAGCRVVPGLEYSFFSYFADLPTEEARRLGVLNAALLRERVEDSPPELIALAPGHANRLREHERDAVRFHQLDFLGPLARLYVPYSHRVWIPTSVKSPSGRGRVPMTIYLLWESR